MTGLPSRRTFIVGALAATLAACSSGGGTSTSASAGKRARKPEWAGLRTSSDLYRTDLPQRFGFAVTDGRALAGGAPASVGFIRPGQRESSPLAATTYRGEGLENGRGIYVTDAVFDEVGIWTAAIEIGPERFGMPFEVTETANAPIIGATVPAAASPTKSKPLGVDPLCTREPACTLHDRSLDGVIGNGRPTAVMFATPARCQTAYCGPVLDFLLAEAPAFADRMDIAHVEIYQGSTGSGLAPTVEAWGLESEPWLFALDATGKVVRRLDGAFDRSEIRDTLSQLA